MKTKIVTSTESLEFIQNETFVFCIELNKGFIKRDLSSVGITDYSFSNVVSTIEALQLEELETLGLNTVVFLNGEEKVSTKMNKIVEQMISDLPNTATVADIEILFFDTRIKKDYFDNSIVETAKDNAISIPFGSIHFPLNDGPGDETGNYVGEINGDPIFTTKNGKNCMFTDGIDDKIVNTGITNSMYSAMSFWTFMKPGENYMSGFGNGIQNRRLSISTYTNDTTPSLYNYWRDGSTSGTYNNNQYNRNDIIIPSEGKWVHVYHERRYGVDADIIKFDGKLSNNNIDGGIGISEKVFNGTMGFGFVTDNNSDQAYMYRMGYTRNIRIFNRPLSDNEIEAIIVIEI